MGEELLELEDGLLAAVVLVVLVAGVLVVVPDVLVVGGLVVLVLVVVADLAAVATVLVRASAGSWPETSRIVISNQVATNSASALATTRWRMPETRAIRAWRMAIPRARRSDGEGVMSVPLVTKGGAT
ncbi:MAG: hypothetical protein M3Y09_13510 [Actinomycetota bacterium]|nr:hypothetical protein [Actinomycetota bacterium]